MKHISKSLLTLLLAGLLGLSGCIKNEVSEGLEAVRNAQAALLNARAEYQQALAAVQEAEAALIAQETLTEAEQTRADALQNDLDAATNANTIALELAELQVDLINEEENLAYAEADLADAQAYLAEVLADVEDDQIKNALQEYQNTLADLNSLVGDRIAKEKAISIAQLLWIAADIIDNDPTPCGGVGEPDCGVTENISWTFYMTYLEGEVADAEAEVTMEEEYLTMLETILDNTGSLEVEFATLLTEKDDLETEEDELTLEIARVNRDIDDIEDTIDEIEERPSNAAPETPGGAIGNYELLAEIAQLHTDLITSLTDGLELQDVNEDYMGGINITNFAFYNDFLGLSAGDNVYDWIDMISDGAVDDYDVEPMSLVELQEDIDAETDNVATYQAGLDAVTARAAELQTQVDLFVADKNAAEATLDEAVEVTLAGLWNDLVGIEAEYTSILAAGGTTTAILADHAAKLAEIVDLVGPATTATDNGPDDLYSTDPGGVAANDDDNVTRVVSGFWFAGRADAAGRVTNLYHAGTANAITGNPQSPLTLGELQNGPSQFYTQDGLAVGAVDGSGEFTAAASPFVVWTDDSNSTTDLESLFEAFDNIPGTPDAIADEYNYLVNEAVLFTDGGFGFRTMPGGVGAFATPIMPVDGYVNGDTPTDAEVDAAIDPNSDGATGNIAAWQSLVDAATEDLDDATAALADQNAAITAITANITAATPILTGMQADYDAALLELADLEASLVELNTEILSLINNKALITSQIQNIDLLAVEINKVWDEDYGTADQLVNPETLEALVEWLEGAIEDQEEVIFEAEQAVREATFNLATATPDMMEDEAMIVKLQAELAQINAQIEAQQGLVDHWKGVLDGLLAG